MEEFYNEILLNLETAINDIETEPMDSIRQIEIIIQLIIDRLATVKEYVLKTGFKDINEEIRFFKYQKPAIVAKIIYYNTKYRIEIRKPNEVEAIKKYLNVELKKLERFFNNNLEFYKYYRTNNTFLDEKLFVRGNHDIKLCLDTNFLQSDLSFCTSHDYKAAKILANDLIQIYIEDQLSKITNANKSGNGHKLKWTSSKAALTELIYGLHCQGVFDNGNSDIRLIAKYFENVFNIDLGDFYHTYMELRARKVNRTKFLDSLKEALLKKMNEREEEL